MSTGQGTSLRFVSLSVILSIAISFTISPPNPTRSKCYSSVSSRLLVSFGKEFESLIEAAASTSSGNVLGGDFAGLAATFSPGDGTLIPIPEYLVPRSLIEWGQEPKCLEVLVSEDFSKTATFSLTRNTITVLPDTGCSIDNLETVKVTDEIDLSSLYEEIPKVVGLQYSTSEDELRVETIFGLEDGHRIRVAIDLIPSDSVFAIQSPMVLVLERRTSASSSGGTIADGGGLDGRTVSILLGEKLRKSKTFAEQPPLEDSYESEGIQFVSFPGNVSIAYGWLSDDEWVLQVGQVLNGIRRVISRKFSLVDDGELSFDLEGWEEEV